MNVWQVSAPSGRAARFVGWVKKALPLAAVLFFAGLMGAATGLGLGVLIVIFVLMLVVGGLMFWDYRVGVLALILVMPVSGTALFPQKLFGITGFSPENILLLGAASFYFLTRAFSGEILRIPKAVWLLYILPMVLAGLLGTLYLKNIYPAYLIDLKYSGPASYLRDVLLKPILYVLYAYMVAAVVRDSRQPVLFLWVYAISLLLMAGVVFFGAVSTGLGLSGLASSSNRGALSAVVGRHANELGPMLVTGIVFLLFALTGIRSRPALRMVCVLVMLASACAVMLTFSRAAFLAMTVSAGFFFFGAKNGLRLLLGLLFVSVAFMLVPQEVIDRVTEGVQPGAADVGSVKNDKLTAGRVSGIWLPVLGDIVQSPVIGRGLMSMLWSNASWHDPDLLLVTHPHNAYLRLLMDMGVLGAAMVLGGVYLLWRWARRLAQDEHLPVWLQSMARGLAMAVMAYALICVTGSSWMPVPMQAFLWGAVGMVYGASVKYAAAKRGEGL